MQYVLVDKTKTSFEPGATFMGHFMFNVYITQLLSPCTDLILATNTSYDSIMGLDQALTQYS